jgi:hypothetical protein
MMTPLSFGYRLATPVEEQVVVPGGAATAQCPGSLSDPQAAPGYICIYAQYGTTTPYYILVHDVESTLDGQTGHTGAVIYTSNGSVSGGTWALTAP